MKRKTALIGFGTLVFLAGYQLSGDPAYTQAANHIQLASDSALVSSLPDTIASASAASIKRPSRAGARVDSLVKFAFTLMGDKYLAGGNKPGGFDCSGFTNFIYSRFGLDVPHGSVNQAVVGVQVTQQEAEKGDLLIFTGTNLNVREPGHTGIIISEKGQPIEFIHSSSNGGVKVSKVPGTRYSERLLQIRRVL